VASQIVPKLADQKLFRHRQSVYVRNGFEDHGLKIPPSIFCNKLRDGALDIRKTLEALHHAPGVQAPM
jgi:hypothetical protein